MVTLTLTMDRSVEGRDSVVRRQRGFSLIEMIVSVAFIASLAGLIVNFAFQAMKADTDTGARAEVTAEVVRSTRWLVRDVHAASVSDLGDGAPAAATATFTWPDGETCTYDIAGGALRRTCNAVASDVTRGISNLGFTRTGRLVTAQYRVTANGRPDVFEDVSINIALGGG